MTATHRPRRWRRRLLWVFAILVAARLLLALLLPWLLGLAARAGGLALDYRAANLSLSGLSLRLDDVVLRDPANGDEPPLLAAQEVFVDVATWQLLRGRLVVVDVALTGGRVHVVQQADGQLRLPAAWQTNGATAEPVAASPEPAAPLRFESPLQVASLRVHDLRLVVADAATATQTEFTLDAEVADIGHEDRPGSITARLHSPGRIDALGLQATLALTGSTAAATWQMRLRGLRPEALPWLDDPAARPARHVIGLDLEGELQARIGDGDRLPTIAAGVHLRTEVDEQPQLAIDVAAGPSQTTPDAWDLPIAVSASGPDLVDALRLADARLVLASDRTLFDGALSLEGATLRRVAPWLASVGILMPAAGLSLQAGLHASIQAGQMSAEIVDLTLGSGEQQLELPRLAIRDVQTQDGALQIGAIEVAGPRVGVHITATGDVEVLGMRLSTPTRVAAATAAPAATPAAPFPWPQLRVRNLDWQGVDVRLVDQSLPAPAELTIGLDLHGERLAVGHAAPPGKLTARVRVAGSLAELRADFDVTPAVDAIAVDGRCTATGVTARSLAPWLQRAGLTPQLQNGTGRARLAAQLRADATTMGMQAHIADVRFEDGDEVLLGLRRIDGTHIVLAPALDLGTWSIDEPYVVVQRRASAGLAALGFDIGPAPTAAAAPAPAPAPGTAAPPAVSATTPSAEVRHGTFELRRAVLRWIDASRPTPADISVGLDLRLEPRAAAAGGSHAFVAAVRLDPGIGTLDVTGTLQRSTAGGRVDAELRADHLRGEGLQALLPPELACTLGDGTLRTTLAAEWQRAAALGLRVSLRDTALQDRSAELFAIDAVEVDLPELSTERVHVASATLRGVRAVAAATPDGLHVPGFQFLPAPPPPPPPPAPVLAVDAAAAVVVPPLVLPALRIDAIDLNIDRLTWRQRGATDGEPLVVSARLVLAEPWATAADPTATPPCRLQLQAAAMPLCREITVNAGLAPFALAPTVDLEVRANGINTTALTRVLPDLASSLTGTCADATFTTTVHGRLDLRRRDPLRFDFGSPFGGELVFAATELREAGSDITLLHVDEVAIDLRAFDPRTGDVLLRSIEVEAPRLDVENGVAGLACLGVRLTPPPPTAATVDAPADAPTPLPPPGAPAAEFAIDRISVQGLDLTYTDPTTEPPTVLPLRDSELKVRNVSTRALTEARPIAFAATLRGGDVTLERRVQRSSVFAGLLGSAADALAGNADRFEPEHRPLVDEISLAGQVQPFPQPKGQVRAVVNALELPALRGLAKQSGVDIADGVFDFTLDADLQGAAGANLRLRPKFTWLSLSEPPGGPISTYLKLPAPLDTVLFALRNDDDEHVLPLHLELPPAGLSGGAIAGAAAEALVRLIADAVASAAFRVGGVVTGAVGLGGGPDPRALVATLDFGAGDPLPIGGSLAPVLAAAADDAELTIVLTHELGHGDLERAAELASPPPDVIAASVVHLAAARRDLERERAALAGRTAALFGAGRVQEAWQQHAILRGIDDRLGALVRTQEEALRMSVGENERAGRRRARAAAVTMAEARLQSVRQQIEQQFGAAMAQRVEWRAPRGLEAAGLPAGGRVVATVRRRAAP